MALFGINGVRGKVNKDLTAEVALQIGRAVGMSYGKRMAIAVDARDSAEMLRSALSSGMMAVGCDVVDLGMLPTPALQYYVRTHDDITGGVMITASHNPPEDNGFKFIGPDGMEVTSDDEAALEDFYSTQIDEAPWSEMGEMYYDQGAADYVGGIVSKIDVDAVRNANLKVCVELFNGSTCSTTPSLLKELGVTAITINADPGNGFVGMSSEPTEDHLSLLKTLVRESGADLGVAHDSDGDRTIFIDSTGRFIEGDLSLAVMCRYILKAHRGKVVTPVSSSKLVEDAVSENGGILKYTPVGSHMIVRKIVENKAIFGGEENGGMVFPEFQFCRDGGMTLAKMLECIAVDGPLDKQTSDMHTYVTIKTKVDCPDDMKEDLLDHFIQEYSDVRIDPTDGVKVFYDDGWVLMRPSTTEECFRIYSESTDASKAKERATACVDDACAFLFEKKDPKQ